MIHSGATALRPDSSIKPPKGWTDPKLPALPKLAAFDLDYTLWDLWVDTHVRTPLKRKGDDVNRIFDKRGKAMSFYEDVPKILLRLQNEKVHIAACSRTEDPPAARQALRELHIPRHLTHEPKSSHAEEADPADLKRSNLVSSIELFDSLEIYPSSKIKHFTALHQKTGIPYDEMVFYDDEPRNREVERLGVTFVLVPDGMTTRLFEDGLKEWARRKQKKSSI